MKELTIQQKARAYDEAIKKASAAYKDEDRHLKATLERIFPDLYESENERIRKEMLDFFNGFYNNKMPKAVDVSPWIAWLEKQSTPQVRTGLEWVNTIDDACDKRYAEEYAHGEYCHEQSFKWGFQEGVDWLEKQGESTDINPSEFDLRLNKLLKQFETLPKEELASSLSFYLNVVQNDGTYKDEEKQGEQNPIINVPSREVILAIWDLGNEWKELTNGSISTEYGTQLDYIQKHWHESEYYLREKQGEQNPCETCEEARLNCQNFPCDRKKNFKPADKVEPKFKVGDWITIKE